MSEQVVPPQPAPRSNRTSLWIGTAALLALAIGGYLYWQGDEPSPSAPARPAATQSEPAAGPTPSELDSTPVDVQVTKPTRRDLVYTVKLPANVSPLYQTTLYAKVSGYLKWIGPDKGDAVKRNEVVAVIDAPEVEEQYQQAVSDYRIKKLTYERLAKVWKESPDVIAKQDVDVAEASYQGARHLMEQRVVMRDYTKVRAPYDGIVTARFADPGSLIQIATSSAASAIPLFTIMDLSTVRVYANVPQDDSPWVVPGKTSATVKVTELPDRTFNGVVTRSTLALDPATRSLLVEIDLPNADHALRPGTFAEVALGLREIPQALVVPPQAVISTPKGTSVFIIEEGKAKSVPVKTGISDGRWIEITSGLQGHEDVVAVGKRRLLDGMPVVAAPLNLPDAKLSQQKFERRVPGGTPPPPNSPLNGTSQKPGDRP